MWPLLTDSFKCDKRTELIFFGLLPWTLLRQFLLRTESGCEKLLKFLIHRGSKEFRFKKGFMVTCEMSVGE